MSTPATQPLSGDLLTYEEAATLLGIQVGAVKRAVGAGKLHPIKLPGSARKYLRRGEVESYPMRRNAPVERRENAPAPQATPTASATPDAAKLHELAVALSGPTIEAAREAQVTARRTIEGLVQIACGIALGQMGAQAQDPKTLAG